MADYISKIRTKDGDKQIDYNALANRPWYCAVTLLASGWDATAKTQTVAATGVLADETKQFIQPSPAAASMTAYYDAGIMCTGQAANSLTFTTKVVPASDLTVYVAIFPMTIA